MFAFVDIRLFDYQALSNQLLDAYRLRFFSALTAFGSIGVISTTSMMNYGVGDRVLLFLTGIIIGLSAVFAYRVSKANIDRLSGDLRKANSIRKNIRTMPWSEELVNEVAHWARMNEVKVCCAFTPSNRIGTNPLVYFGFESLDDSMLFRLKWV